ncbi:hypothetical protein [Streptomyces sp. NPDC050560]|uniref:hypothetical protein n=1 Tax=Streptomyces sp. NPDC050560 TaxID=3365630 RepID=UPI0037AE20EB
MTTPGQQPPLPPQGGNPFAPQPGPYGPPPQGQYGAPPYGAPPQQGGYGYPPPPQGGYGQQQAPYGAPPPQGGYGMPPQGGAPGYEVCVFCGGGPATRVTFRGHQGQVIMMRFLKMPGPMCHTCGTAVFRRMTVKTLWQGWWSPVSLFLGAPLTLIWNLIASGRVRKLPPPEPGRHGPQVAPEEPVLNQPLAYVALIPIGWICYLLLQGMGVA